MIIDGHAHACGVFISAQSIEKYLTEHNYRYDCFNEEALKFKDCKMIPLFFNDYDWRLFELARFHQGMQGVLSPSPLGK